MSDLRDLHAHVFNAITRGLSEADRFVALSERERITVDVMRVVEPALLAEQVTATDRADTLAAQLEDSKADAKSAWQNAQDWYETAQAREQRAEQAEDRLRAAEQAYQQLADRHTDAEATRDRWRKRAETAEAEARRFRGLAEGLQTELRAAITAQGQTEAAIERVQAAIESERTGALESEAMDGPRPSHDARINTCARIEDALDRPETADAARAALEPPKETT